MERSRNGITHPPQQAESERHYGMTNLTLVPADIRDRYDVYEWRNGLAVLHTVYPECWADIQGMLRAFTLTQEDILKPGGSKSGIATRLDSYLEARGWIEKQYETAVVVDGAKLDSPTHKVDCVKREVALEIEWNNKDPFYDRDLNNFRQLFDLRAIAVGVIVTRASELQDIFVRLGKGPSYGNSTTHIGKLLPRLEGGAGGGCPIVVLALRDDRTDDHLYTVQYCCPRCSREWTDEWSAACDEECPECGLRAIQPYAHELLTEESIGHLWVGPRRSR